jgi:hypothetical protein
MKDGLGSLWRDLALLRSTREAKHLALLRKLVGDEDQWGWAEQQARLFMRHFADLRPIDRLGDQADFSLSHGAVELAAEQALADIGTFEAEKATKR